MVVEFLDFASIDPKMISADLVSFEGAFSHRLREIHVLILSFPSVVFIVSTLSDAGDGALR